MNLVVQVYFRDELVLSCRLDKPLMKWGRGPENDFQLLDPSLSRLHLIIRQTETGWSLQDCSQNGIQIDESPLPQRALPIQTDKLYRIGKNLSLKFSEAQGLPLQKAVTQVLSGRPTQVISFDETSEKLSIQKALLRWTDESGEVKERYVHDEGLSLGRHPSNDICLKHESISQFHARIAPRQQQFYITDLGSTNGSFVEETHILDASLPQSASLRLGQFPVEFVLEKEQRSLTQKSAHHFFGITSKHPKMQKIFSLIETVAPTDAAVFIQGESGTGKELVARALHQLSQRAEKSFVAINCAAIPKELLESELFGHKKGAFSGAIEDRKGAFECADGGTLFLDEIAEMDLELQAKLLRVLENGEIRPVGSEKTKMVDVRLVSATHQKIAERVQEEKFRSDLFFRLHVVPVPLLPLRDRIEDLDLLVPELLEKLQVSQKLNRDAINRLYQYSFPGNIRELKNILQRAAILAKIDSAQTEIGSEHLAFLDQKNLPSAFVQQKDEDERRRILSALERRSFIQSHAAKDLGLAVSTLHDRIRRLRIEIPKKKDA